MNCIDLLNHTLFDKSVSARIINDKLINNNVKNRYKTFLFFIRLTSSLLYQKRGRIDIFLFYHNQIVNYFTEKKRLDLTKSETLIKRRHWYRRKNIKIIDLKIRFASAALSMSFKKGKKKAKTL